MSELPSALHIRYAISADLDALVAADLAVDAEDSVGEPIEAESWTQTEHDAHREKIGAFVGNTNNTAWVCEEVTSGKVVGALLVRFRNRKTELRTEANDYLFRYIDEAILPPDRRFVEIFQLWVHPEYRRRGLATQMKRACEDEARRRGVQMVYTHTRERNAHVIELNRKLGYVEIRRGAIWDDYVRVSLVKWL